MQRKQVPSAKSSEVQLDSANIFGVHRWARLIPAELYCKSYGHASSALGFAFAKGRTVYAAQKQQTCSESLALQDPETGLEV